MSQPKHSYRCGSRRSRADASAISSASLRSGEGRAWSIVSKACRRQPQAQHLRASAAARSIMAACSIPPCAPSLLLTRPCVLHQGPRRAREEDPFRLENAYRGWAPEHCPIADLKARRIDMDQASRGDQDGMPAASQSPADRSPRTFRKRTGTEFRMADVDALLPMQARCPIRHLPVP